MLLGQFPRRIKKRSAPSVAGAALWSSAPAIWHSTLGLPRALRAPLQPPRPQRVSDTLRPSLGEEGRPLVRPLGPRLSGLGNLGYPAGAEALGLQKRTRSGGVGRGGSWGGRAGTKCPTRSSHAACGFPQGSALLGFASRLHRVGLGETGGGSSVPLPEIRPLLPTSAPRTRGNAHMAFAAGPGEDRAGGVPRAQPCGSWVPALEGRGPSPGLLWSSLGVFTLLLLPAVPTPPPLS